MVKLIQTTAELIHDRSQRDDVAFVPTMGNLHQGHISLLREALISSHLVYFSIFVNPKQFGPHEDFARYPRTLQDDLNLIENIAREFPKAQVIVYAPLNPAEVFPPEAEQKVSVLGLNSILEGEIRPEHFDGVTTVVYRLFDLIKPARAYFGLKDYQQYLVIKKMVEDLAIPTQIIGMPIIREPSGLALSSRNQYLSADEKKEALTLYQALKQIEQKIAGSKANIKLARQEIAAIKKDPRWNYLELRDAETLSEDLSKSKRATLLGVYQLGTTRLLDNLQMELS